MSTREELEQLNEEEKVKNTMNLAPVEHIKDEFLFLLHHSSENGKKRNYRMFYGIGVVQRVVKGEKQDLVYVNFSMFAQYRPRLVVIYENHARRQLITLKRGQVCQVYGMCRYYYHKAEYGGEQHSFNKLGLYAKAINGWYVPTMFDIRKMPTNEDLEEPNDKEKEFQKTMEEVLNDFMTGGFKDDDE